MDRVLDEKSEVGLRPMISIAEILQSIPISRTTLDQLVKDGEFPKPRRVASLKLAFFLDEVIQWQQKLTCEIKTADAA
jgi:predicted DNA-binding transcriptional regulator AlpA